MNKIHVLNISIVVVVLIIINESVGLRRDSTWPPPKYIELANVKRVPCLAKYNITLEMVHQFSDGPTIIDNPNLKCYMMCNMIASRVWNEDGSANPKTTMETLSLINEADQMVLINMGRPCVLKFNKVKDLCERAFSIQKCMKERDPENYFLL